MRKVRREIREEYLYIHDVPCVLHMLNLVSGDFLKSEATAQLEVGLGRVSSLFRCSHVRRDVLKKWTTSPHVIELLIVAAINVVRDGFLIDNPHQLPLES